MWNKSMTVEKHQIILSRTLRRAAACLCLPPLTPAHCSSHALLPEVPLQRKREFTVSVFVLWFQVNMIEEPYPVVLQLQLSPSSLGVSLEHIQLIKTAQGFTFLLKLWVLSRNVCRDVHSPHSSARFRLLASACRAHVDHLGALLNRCHC